MTGAEIVMAVAVVTDPIAAVLMLHRQSFIGCAGALVFMIGTLAGPTSAAC